ncbi:MAG: DNA integrity scanning protein DisA nucleotide-binding domain protein [Actinomycetota bacterium]
MTSGPVRRLGEELDELDPAILTDTADRNALLEELSYAIRPPIHERRVPSYGAFVRPERDLADWAETVGFEMTRRKVDELSDAVVRRFADGIVSWVVRGPAGVDDLVVFDRSVGSERDLSVLADSTGAAIVQRHPAGVVRAVGRFGVLRYSGVDWQLEPPVGRWLDLSTCLGGRMEQSLFDNLMRFAVHDVAARRIGSMMIVAPDGRLLPSAERRYGPPPRFSLRKPADLAPLYHILGQLDGAAVFDEEGVLRHLGVRLVPSAEAELAVDPYRGTRHTSALRYSYDDSFATIVVVSEDGPVSVVRGGKRLGQSWQTDDRR